MNPSDTQRLQARLATIQTKSQARSFFEDASAALALDYSDYADHAGLQTKGDISKRFRKETMCFRAIIQLFPDDLRETLSRHRDAIVDDTLEARDGFPAAAAGSPNRWLRMSRGPADTWSERGGISPCDGPVQALLVWFIKHTGIAARVLSDPTPALADARFNPAKISLEDYLARFHKAIRKSQNYSADNFLAMTPEHVFAGYLERALSRFKDKDGRFPYKEAFSGLRYDFKDPAAALARLSSLESIAHIARKTHQRMEDEGRLPKPPSKQPPADLICFAGDPTPRPDPNPKPKQDIEKQLKAVVAALSKVAAQGQGTGTPAPTPRRPLTFCRNCGGERAECPKGVADVLDCIKKVCGRCGAAGCNIGRCPVGHRSVTCSHCKRMGHTPAACHTKKMQAAAAQRDTTASDSK
jgi:hypothetical protein